MQVVRPAEASAKLGVCNTTLYKLVKDGKLPPPIRIAPNCSGWLESDLDAYIEACAKSREPMAAA